MRYRTANAVRDDVKITHLRPLAASASDRTGATLIAYAASKLLLTFESTLVSRFVMEHDYEISMAFTGQCRLRTRRDNFVYSSRIDLAAYTSTLPYSNLHLLSVTTLSA